MRVGGEGGEGEGEGGGGRGRELIEKLVRTRKPYADDIDIYYAQGEDLPIKYAKPVTTTFIEAPK